MSVQARIVNGVLRLGRRRGSHTAQDLRRELPSRPAAETLPSDRARRGLTVSVEQHDGRDVYVLTPAGTRPARTVLYLHGGYYLFGISPLHWSFVRRLALETPATVVVPLYGTAPETTASTTVPSMARLLSALVERHGAEDVVVMGDSAGGGMALAVAQEHRAAGGAATRRVVLVSPWLDVATDHPDQAAMAARDLMLRIPVAQEAGRLYAGDLALDEPRVSPLHGDLQGLGPVDVFVGTDEIVVVDARRLAAKCASVTVHEAPRMQHVYPILPLLPEGRAARRAIVALVRS